MPSASTTLEAVPSSVVAGAAAVGLMVFVACHRDHPKVLPQLPEETAEVETAHTAIRLEQARGRPSPWHWRKTNGNGSGAESGSALLSAASSGDSELLQRLLDSGTDIHHRDRAEGAEDDKAGWTAFHVACWHGHTNCVHCLVRCGCDTGMTDEVGRTGRDLAQVRGNVEVMTLLDGALAELKARRQAEKKVRRKKQKKMRAVLSRALANLKGDAARGLILELGVASGQSINFIADNLPATVTDKGNGLVYGFDSFEGLPERWRDGYDAGFFNRNGVAPKVRDNVRLYKGWFSQTLPGFLTQQKEQNEQQQHHHHHQDCTIDDQTWKGQQLRVGFVHMDCDIYSSTRFALVRCFRCFHLLVW